MILCLPSLCKIQLQSNSMLAWRKYLPSVHRAAFVPVIMAVPENMADSSIFDDGVKSKFSCSIDFLSIMSIGNRFPGVLTMRSAKSRNEFPPLMLWRNIFALKHLTCVSLFYDARWKFGEHAANPNPTLASWALSKLPKCITAWWYRRTSQLLYNIVNKAKWTTTIFGAKKISLAKRNLHCSSRERSAVTLTYTKGLSIWAW